MGFTFDPLHNEISWLRVLFSELLRFFGDRADLFALQRQSFYTLTRSRETTLQLRGLGANIKRDCPGH